MELYKLTAHELHDMYAKKEVSATEVTKSYIERIEKVEPKVESYITLTTEAALKKAAEVDEKISKGDEIKPLEGIPTGIKDNMCTNGVKTTCASKMLYNFVPPYNATVMDKLESEGIVMLGKLNMDEFAMGSSTENSYFKKTSNPWDIERVPGGSSGGSAAAVAADEAVFTLGSDTGGSIRQPAHFCGVVGMKPTYGRVSRFGLVAFASSLDQIGPLTKDVTDCALVLNAICGKDKMDSTSAPIEVPDFTKFLTGDVNGLRIGMPKEYFGEGINPEVNAKVLESIKLLEARGAKIVEVSLPNTKYSLEAYYIIASAEASSNLARFDGVKYGFRAENFEDLVDMYKETRSQGFGAEVKRRIMLGTYALSSGYYDAYYKKALQVRTLIKNEFDKAFEACDVIMTPAAPTTAFKKGEKTDNPLEMYMQDICTVPVNIAGLPGMVLPCGLDSAGLPIGLQIIGKGFDEGTMLKAAYAFEQNSDFRKNSPKL
jgi:aspartyl-tRNA(Asn)/glutamyl-tRNA(Gln) amidotransferase subunit A